MKKKASSVREAALQVIEAVEKEQSYSNLLLNKTINQNQLSSLDAALLTEITYGTIQRKLTLDYYLQPFIKGKLQNWVRNLLRLTAYQLIYLDRVPDHAAIYEAVEIAKKHGHQGLARFTNGVLRSLQRSEPKLKISMKDKTEQLAIATSHPSWLVKDWVAQYGFEKTEKICFANLKPPKQAGRINLLVTSVENCIAELEAEGYKVKQSELIAEGILSLKGNIAKSKAFEKGYFTIQDESSMLVAKLLDPQKGETVIDLCAAPGGKATHLAEKMANSGQVTALDIHKHKIKLIDKQAERLGLNNIITKALDSRTASEHYGLASFDRVLLDAPCSGFGVIRRKPDLKYRKTKEDVLKLQEVQLRLLDEAAKLVKEDGLLVYSTCTINFEENNHVIEKFLNKYEEFELDETLKSRVPEEAKALVNNGQLQLFPDDFATDGFFIACLRKKVSK